jgi:hypothetical protein
MEVYWHDQTLGLELATELNIYGVFGNPKVRNKSDKDAIYGKKVMDEIPSIGYMFQDGAGVKAEVRKKDLPGYYRLVYMNRKQSEVWKSVLTKSVMNSDNFAGVVLADSEETFISWRERREWVTDFVTRFRRKCVEYGLKRNQVKIYVRVSDVVAIADLWQLVEGVFLLPIHGILYESRFVLPMGGYLDLGREDAVDAIRETLEQVGQLVGVKQNAGEAFEDYIVRLQCHVFNYEVAKLEFTASGGKLEQFTYNDVKIDIDAIYALAVVKGVTDTPAMLDMITSMKKNIDLAVDSGDNSHLINSLGRLYAILLARVELGTELDSANYHLSDIVSKDVGNALAYGIKIAQLIGEIRDKKFNEKIQLAKLQQEQVKIKILNKKVGDGKPIGTNTTVLDVLEKLDSEDAKDYLDQVESISEE